MSDENEEFISPMAPAKSLEEIAADAPLTFDEELVQLLNKYSKENASGTPDWILAEYLLRCLRTWDATIQLRSEWRSESVELPALQQIQHDRGQAERVMAKIKQLVDEGIIHVDTDIRDTEVYRQLTETDGKEVPLVMYENGRRNEIGTAKVKVTPGEARVTGTINGAIPMFLQEPQASYSLDEPNDDPLPDRRGVDQEQTKSAFQRYQERGLSDG